MLSIDGTEVESRWNPRNKRWLWLTEASLRDYLEKYQFEVRSCLPKCLIIMSEFYKLHTVRWAEWIPRSVYQRKRWMRVLEAVYPFCSFLRIHTER